MKREKFLWPLSQSHHRALMTAKRVRERLSAASEGQEAAVKQMAAEVRKLYEEELCLHFWDEEKMLVLYEGHMGQEEPGPDRIRKEHRQLEHLMAQADYQSLLSFAGLLIAHVRFEEDVFFAQVEKMLGEAEKKTLGDLLQQGPLQCATSPS